MSEEKLESQEQCLETENVEIREEEKTLIKQESIYENFKNLTSDQDFSQKMNVASTLVLELYRVLMGSLLILFVPQKCGDEMCTLNENMERNLIARIGFGLNMLTLLSSCIMYYIEVNREHAMIDNLHVNPEKPRDNDSVKESLSILKDEVKEIIWNYDKHYQMSGYLTLGCFGANVGLSSYVIFSNYLNDKTITVLLTNILFMGSKLNDVFAIVNTEKNIFYSAYLKRKIQFNDVDPDAPLKE